MNDLKELKLTVIQAGPFGGSNFFEGWGGVNGLHVDVSRRSGLAMVIPDLDGSPGSLVVEVSKSLPGMRGRVTVTRSGNGEQPTMQATLAPDRDFRQGLLVAATVKDGQPICQVEAPGGDWDRDLKIVVGKGVSGTINLR